MRPQAQREARIAEEAAAAGPSTRAVEEAQLQELLVPMGLRMREIKVGGAMGDVQRCALPARALCCQRQWGCACRGSKWGGPWGMCNAYTHCQRTLSVASAKAGEGKEGLGGRGAEASVTAAWAL